MCRLLGRSDIGGDSGDDDVDIFKDPGNARENDKMKERLS